MELISTPRIAFLRELVAEILHNYGRGRVIVAVDGPEGSGTAEFADGLAEVLREADRATFRAGIDDFLAPRRERERQGQTSAAGYYEDRYDYRTFRRVLIDPFRMSGSTGFQTKGFDHKRDAPAEARWLTASPDAFLVIDGIFLNRPELAGIWNYSVYLDVPEDIRYARLAERTGIDPDPAAPSNARQREAQKLYRVESNPANAASAIVDNSDEAFPRRVFADSC